MKKIILALSITLITFFSSACSNNSDEIQVKTLYMAEIYPDDTIKSETVNEFAKLVDEYSNGELKIKIYSDFNSESDIVRGISDGTIDFASVNISAIKAQTDATSISRTIEMPFLFKDNSHMFKALELYVKPLLDSNLNKHNIKTLTFFDFGAINIYTMNKLNDKDDLKGINIASCQYLDFDISKIFMDFLEINVVNSDNILNSIKSKEIDGFEGSLIDYYTTGNYNEVKNVLKIEYKKSPDLLIASQSMFDNLTDKQKEVIKTAANKVNMDERINLDLYQSEIEQKLIDAGCIIEEPSEDIINEFKNAANYLYKSGNVYIYNELANQIRDMN